MNQILSIFTVTICFILLMCGVKKSSQDKYKCGRLLTEKEIQQIIKGEFDDYSDEDLDNLAEITTLVIDINGDSLEHEVFYHEKSTSLLVIDIFGVDKPEQIEKTACAIFSRNDLNLPQELKLLFHKYVNGFVKSEFLVGLANK